MNKFQTSGLLLIVLFFVSVVAGVYGYDWLGVSFKYLPSYGDETPDENGCVDCANRTSTFGCKVLDLTGYAAHYVDAKYIKPPSTAKLVIKINIPLDVWNLEGGPWIRCPFASTSYRYPADDIMGHGLGGWYGTSVVLPGFSSWTDREICLILNPTWYSVTDKLTGTVYESPTYTIAVPDWTEKTIPGWAGGRGGYLALRDSTYKLDGVEYKYRNHVKWCGMYEGETAEFTLHDGETRTLELSYSVFKCPYGHTDQNPTGKDPIGMPRCLSKDEPSRECTKWEYRQICAGYGQTCDKWECRERNADGKCIDWHCAGTYTKKCVQWITQKVCVSRLSLLDTFSVSLPGLYIFSVPADEGDYVIDIANWLLIVVVAAVMLIAYGTFRKRGSP